MIPGTQKSLACTHPPKLYYLFIYIMLGSQFLVCFVFPVVTAYIMRIRLLKNLNTSCHLNTSETLNTSCHFFYAAWLTFYVGLMANWCCSVAK